MNVRLVILVIAIITVDVNSQSSCTTPNREQAQCVNIYQCRHFLNALQNKTPEIVDFLRKSTCGFSPSGDPLVCCGSTVGYTTTTSTSDNLPVDNSLLPSRSVCGQSDFSDRIIGGTETTIGEFPWMALLAYRDRRNRPVNGWYCGGALISNRYVLTAAHCVVGDIETAIGKISSVRLGEWDYRTEIDCPKGQGCNQRPIDVNVEEAIAHDQYLLRNNQRGNRHHDIALLRLSSPVEFSEFVTPVCLPTQGEKAELNSIVHVAGWGLINPNSGEYSPVKLKVNLTMFEQSKCADLFKRNNGVNIIKSQLCAGGAKGKDSCNGDSGGPLMKLIPGASAWYIEGIVSYGPQNCGTEGVPGIYTRVAEYLGWITKNMRS